MKNTILMITALVTIQLNASPLGKLAINTRIVEDLKAVKVEIANKGGEDIYCESLSFELIFEDPENYIEVATENIPLVDAYFRQKGERQWSAFKVGHEEWAEIAEDIPGAVIKEARLNPELSSCKTADFLSYARYAPKTEAEWHTLYVLQKATGKKSPEELQERIPSKDILDLEGYNLTTIKGIEFFYDLDVLDLSRNPIKSLRGLAKLPELRKLNVSDTDITSLKELYPRNQKIRLRAKGIRLEDPKELSYFRKY